MGVIRELSPDAIEELLHSALIARIACCDHKDSSRPYLVPIAYGYDGESLFIHSGPGRKIDLMRNQPLVSVEVDEGTASDQWRSVVVEGTYAEITDASQQLAALRTMYKSRPVPELAPEVIICKIVVTRKTGRYELPD